jgi:hypothetical protein
MSKLMWIAGILLAAAGVALGTISLAAAAPIGALTFETAAILLVGGILAIGLGSVIEELRRRPETIVTRAAEPAPAPAVIPEFDPRAAKTVAAAPAEVSKPTRETIEVLEKARQEIEQAFEPKPSAPAMVTAAEQPAEPAKAAAEPEMAEAKAEEEVAAEGQLYVLEERLIRRRPARILSDGTVEAETAEGWMRFENLEHLDEYFDAMESARA